MCIILFLALLCVMAGEVFADEGIKPTRDESQVTLRLHLSGTRERTKEACADIGIRLAGEGGCAKFNLDTKECDVYVAEPRDAFDDRMTLLGHEVYHCFKGVYHTHP